ncbi:MAG TPA: hypothetical protein VNH11_20015 [Pirellulales bacterium]|nr:hypothetical protein [Pirellulales bacterium]
MLRRFKQEYPAWSELAFRNSVIELQPRYIYVSHFEVDSVKRTGFVDRLTSGWQRDLKQMLEVNTSRIYGLDEIKKLLEVQ